MIVAEIMARILSKLAGLSLVSKLFILRVHQVLTRDRSSPAVFSLSGAVPGQSSRTVGPHTPTRRKFGGNRSFIACHRSHRIDQPSAGANPMFKPFTILCLASALSAAPDSAQVSSPSQSNLPSSGPVAYVYVASSPGNGEPNVIVGYSASSNGALTPIPGSPFQQNAGSMAVNGKYLMAVNNSSPPNIDTLQIGSKGALTYVTSTPCAQTSNGCLTAFNLFFDHTGSDLYVMLFDENTNDDTESFRG
jgi:hypothetical protein